MKLNLRVTFDGGNVQDVKATARDLVAFEDEFTKPISVIDSDFHVKYMLWIAWHWCKRTNATNLEFAEWCDTVDEIEAGEESPK